ncbi:hypothetical protein HJP15_01030 [Pseudoalteromonas sp. NEC-BIFX-2020_002]|uniref:hypothetical protein n=1 Tax=Pseudoalteromonas sp. NEC-BIFX-2020_002 TaxID=2732353 RepID=UPI0014771597|nr:hypothetical protein [Pseudoalteromonas sp. NEC-BIFX-2020_002]NNG41535.1 hypothetical protein [Pseudoalteromonas sp. NEC-BIFX-2020_002]
MNIAKLIKFLIISCLLTSCANVSYYIGSVPSMTAEPKFNPNETYSYYDDDVSNMLEFGKFELMVSPYNTIQTDGHFELFFIPVEQHGSAQGSVGRTPFKISVSVKGQVDTTKFLPFKATLNGGLKVNEVKWRDPEPSCVYSYTDWSALKLDTVHIVKDRLRNQQEKCMKPGWVEYLLVFEATTPDPTSKFSLELFFQDIESNQTIRKNIFFNAAKFISTQTH